MITPDLPRQDPLAFKVIRNLSQQDINIKLKFRPYVSDLVYLLKLEAKPCASPLCRLNL